MTVMQLFRAWAIIAIVMVANGAFRELVLAPRLGSGPAEVISVVLGVIWIVLLTRVLLRRLAGRSVSELVRASVILVGLTVAFEFLFGHYVDGKSWGELAANYEIWNGRLWPVALAVVAMMPFVWGRRQLPPPRSDRDSP
jgi:hypothetical protein